MRKKVLKFIFIILIAWIIILEINLVFAEIKINEVEMNPSGEDAGHEWIELYSDGLINLDGWKLINSRNEIKNLNGNVQSNSFLVINFSEQWLRNENETLNLYNNNNSLISFTPQLKDTVNDKKTWSFCNPIWSQLSPSPGYANNCIYQNNSQNNTQNNSQTPALKLELEWDDNDIKNGKEFEIRVKADNLKDNEYDIKLLIYDENIDSPISDTYSDGKWTSSKYYIKKILNGPGSDSNYIKLRIKESKRDFSGNAQIAAMMRASNSSSYENKTEEDIDIIKADAQDLIQKEVSADADSDRENVAKEIETQKTENTGEIIHLTGSKISKISVSSSAVRVGESIKTNKNIVYESENEKIKRYSVYAFIFLIVMLIILFLLKIL